MSNKEKLEDLKKLLTSELLKPDIDTNLILTLSNQIAELDENNVRFTVDAGLINRLGKELVAKEETAVSELIKNAYDADAVEVNVFFNDTIVEGGTLIIDDDGVGMNRQQLINGFMKISSTDKVENPTSPLFDRKRAGRKGIGRFATQRLGERLIIITQCTDSNNALKIVINWNDFDQQKDLLLIQNSIEIIKKDKDSGTTLYIENLREKWTHSKIKRVYSYINDLLQPFPLSKKKFTSLEDQRNINLSDPGFKSSFFMTVNGDLENIIDEQTTFFQHAVADIEGYILDDGQGVWSYKSEKLNSLEEIILIGKLPNDFKSKFKYLRNVHLKIYYFIHDSSLIPTKFQAQIKETTNEKGGIRIYRNGFRVFPYGERRDDWVGFDESNRRKTIVASHGNNSFIGFVEITDNQNIFEELASREGFIENEAYRELQDFLYRVTITAVLKTADLRGRKGKAHQKGWIAKGRAKKESTKDTLANAKKVLNRLQELSLIKSNDNQSQEATNESDDNETKDLIKSLEGTIEIISENIDEQEQIQEEIQKELLEENSMLRVLASLGLIIGEFTHEIKRFLTELNSDSYNLEKFNVISKELDNIINRISNNVKGLSTYSSYFDRNISNNALREIETIELRSVVNPFIDVIKNDVNRCGFKMLQPVFNGYNLITIPMHKSEWASILFNFYSNSKKAIFSSNTEGVLQIECGKLNKFVYLEFSDNGIGIPDDDDENIFNAFFTTSPPVGLDNNDDLSGTGLGLKIIKDICDSYGGTIFVKRPANSNFSTTIRVEIPIQS
jgi:signal transduction histidine kinase